MLLKVMLPLPTSVIMSFLDWDINCSEQGEETEERTNFESINYTHTDFTSLEVPLNSCKEDL